MLLKKGEEHMNDFVICTVSTIQRCIGIYLFISKFNDIKYQSIKLGIFMKIYGFNI